MAKTSISCWRLLPLLPLVALVAFGYATVTLAQSQSVCASTELCVSEQLCNETDDAGVGRIGPRIALTCGKKQVCCSMKQLNRSNAAVNVRQDDMPEPSPYVSCGQNKECVPRQLCNGTINDDGRFLITPRINDIASDKNAIQVRMADNSSCRGLQICCSLKDRLTASENPFVNELHGFKYMGCGYSNPQGLVINLQNFPDDVTNFGEFPWIVALITGREQYLCGGTLIHPSLVLTSAHNVQNHTVATLLARAGEWDLNSIDEPHKHQTRRIKQIIRHEEFDDEAFFNDIALLVLEEPFALAPHIQPLCLPNAETPKLQRELRAAQCYAAGWGSKPSTPEDHVRLLKRITLPVVAAEECQAKLRLTVLGQRFRLRPSFLCAGGVKGQDTCKGDGGSPLFCTIPGPRERFMLAGIVSWGLQCAEEDIPAAYTNVPYLRSWIDDKIKTVGITLDVP